VPRQHVDDVSGCVGDAEVSVGNAKVTIGPLTDLAVEHPLSGPLAAIPLRRYMWWVIPPPRDADIKEPVI
jgi:hypothetical protein